MGAYFFTIHSRSRPNRDSSKSYSFPPLSIGKSPFPSIVLRQNHQLCFLITKIQSILPILGPVHPSSITQCPASSTSPICTGWNPPFQFDINPPPFRSLILKSFYCAPPPIVDVRSILMMLPRGNCLFASSFTSFCRYLLSILVKQAIFPEGGGGISPSTTTKNPIPGTNMNDRP